MKSPIEKIIANATERLSDWVRIQHDYAVRTESPIEQIMQAALITEFQIGLLDYGHNFGKLYEVNSMQKCEDRRALHPALVPLFLWAQAPVLTYRADMLVLAFGADREWVKLVIECDGHDFHERTKEQAAKDRARDREMQEAGYTVFRFTGSEIYRDPSKCAAQALAWMDKATFL